ncbi:MAG: hypothetical protein RB292_04405 [Patescibacteria group bacterium]|jgi:hypothetical protein|nr:hypothetical protein [Patescibacteria group bacterium]
MSVLNNFSATDRGLLLAGLGSWFFYLVIALIIDYFSYQSNWYYLAVGFLFAVYFIYFLIWANWNNGVTVSPKSFWLVFLLGALLLFTLVLAIPVSLSDFYHYFFEDVALIVHGLNPYFSSPIGIPAEPASWLSGWRFLPAQHGPARIFLTMPLALLSGGSVVTALFLYRLFFGLVVLASALLIYKILENLKSKNSLMAVLLFLWNPLIIYETMLNGGTDILMVFWFLLAIYLVLIRRDYLAILSLTVSIMVKYITILVLPFFIIFLVFRTPGLKSRIIKFFSLSGATILAAILFFWPFWEGIYTLSPVFWVGRQFEANSFPGFVSLIFFLFNYDLDITIFKNLFTIAFAVIFGILLVNFCRQRQQQIENLFYVSMLVIISFLFIGKFWFYPKYLIWLLPLLFLLDRRFYRLAVFLTGLVVLVPIHFYTNLLVVLFIPPVLVFSFYYFVVSFKDNNFKPV